MTMRKKLLITIACLSVILCTLITGTIAWLIDDTDPIVNTFTPSNIEVALTEENHGTDYKFQMIPGKTYAKDPNVKVTTDIPCYVFVKVEENLGAWNEFKTEGKNFKTFLEYSIAEGWTAVPGATGVYYFKTANSTTKYVLTGDAVNENGKITVSGANVTKAMMDKLYENDAVIENVPKLSFTAYACQQEGFATPEAAWAEVQTTVGSSGN